MKTPVVLAMLLVAGSVVAHNGEDHSATKATPAATAKASAANAPGAAPQRLPDGSVRVPKATQHALGLRTVVAAVGEHAQSLELSGRVMADPAASGRLQAGVAGRLEAPPQGWPVLGQKVKRGEVLAYLRPVSAYVDATNQNAQLADVVGQLEVARGKLKRFENLKGFMSEQAIEQQRVEVSALEKRRMALSRGVGGREALLSPADGVISLATVAAGQVVEARDFVFEVVDPQRLMVEALVYDARSRQISGGEAVFADGARKKLVFAGAGLTLREQALPLLFRFASPPAGLAVGQPLKVLAHVGEKANGVVLPALAVIRDESGQQRVWVKHDVEHFMPRLVETTVLGDGQVLVGKGINAGERIVSEGAALLGQVR